jgi:hypothetical protein
MNHQPFEDWLFSNEPIGSQQEASLRQHLENCPSCASMAQAWRSVETEIVRTPQAAPTPGFGKRWQARLAQKRSAQQRSLAWWVIGFNLSAALGIFLALNWNRLTSLSLSKLLVSALYTVTLLFARIDSAEVLFKLLLEEVNPIILISVTALVGTSLCALSLAWIFSMWKIYLPQGVRNEARH